MSSKLKIVYRVTLSQRKGEEIESVREVSVVAPDINSAIRKVKYRLTKDKVSKSIFIDSVKRIGILE